MLLMLSDWQSQEPRRRQFSDPRRQGGYVFGPHPTQGAVSFYDILARLAKIRTLW
jgi:excinuclease UvrABC nuclease subunit